MHLEPPILTISIPTWNRSQDLRGCVEILAGQILQLQDKVDIFITDNGSTDDTQQIIQDLAAQYPFIRHAQNAVNLGADRNFLAAFRGALGDYVWLFSDDDFLTEGTLAKLIQIFKQYRPSYISTNYSWCDAGRKPIEHLAKTQHMVERDLPGANSDTVFAARGQLIGFMGCGIYRRDRLDVDLYEANMERVKHWIHVYAAAHVIDRGNDAYLSSCYAVMSRVGNARDASSVFVKSMPEAFNVALKTYGVNDAVHHQIMDSIRKQFLPLLSYIKYSSLGLEISPLLPIPWYFRMVPRVPNGLLAPLLKVKRHLGHR